MSINIISHNHYSSSLSPVGNLVTAAINRFLIETKRDHTPATYKTYSAKMKLFQEYMERYPHPTSTEAMQQHLREYLKGFRGFLRERYTSASSINLAQSAVRSFYKSLLEKGIIDIDPTHVLKNVKDSNEVKRSHLTRKQLYTILDYLDGLTTINAPRNKAMFLLLLMNGLRVSELANIKTEDIQQHGGRTVIFLKRKGYQEKSNFIVLKEETFQMLLDFIGDREGYVFVSYRSKDKMTGGDISRIIKGIYRACGIDSKAITTHSLRTTYAVMLVEANVPLVSISKSMNHASTATTDRYIKSYNRLSQPAEDAMNFNF